MPSFAGDHDALRRRADELEKRLEEKKRASGGDASAFYVESLFETFEEAPVAFSVYDREGRFVRSNPAHLDLFGGGTPPPDYSVFGDPRLAEYGFGEKLEALRRGEPTRLPPVWYDVREIYPGIPGKRIFVGAFAFPLRDASGEPFCYLLIHDDFTEEKLTRISLEERTEELGKRVRELKGLLEISRIAGDHPETPEKALGDLVRFLPASFSSPETVRARISIAGKVFESSPFEESPVKIEAAVRAEGGIAGSIEVFRNAPAGAADFGEEERSLLEITAGMVGHLLERTRAREAVLKSERLEAVAALSGGIVHDFGNVLLGIVGQAEVLAGDDRLSEESRRRVGTIREAGVELRELIRRLKTLASESPPVLSKVDVHDLLRRVSELFRYSLPGGVRIAWRLTAETHELPADPLQLERAFLNLAVNAGQAMPEGGTLTFETANEAPEAGSPRGRLAVRVSDTGEGMPPAVLEKAFDPFFTTRGGAEGLGLGLATVREVVRRHGGEIRAQSEPGAGTRFEILLPLEGEAGVR